MFHDSYGDFAATFHDAQQDKDPDAATREAHTLKSNAASIGAMSIQHVAYELELVCSQNSTAEEIESALQAVIAELVPVIKGLELFVAAGGKQ